MTGVTPDDVRRRHFGTAPFGHHGYHPGQVDAFCARIADTMSGRDHLSAADIRLVEFDGPPSGHRGYDIDQVDEFLDRICMDLEYLRRGHPLIAPVRQEDPLTHDDVLRVRFSAPPSAYPVMPQRKSAHSWTDWRRPWPTTAPMG